MKRSAGFFLKNVDEKIILNEIKGYTTEVSLYFSISKLFFQLCLSSEIMQNLL